MSGLGGHNPRAPWVLLQADDRPLTNEFKRAVDLNRKYCARHRYRHLFISTRNEKLPPYWNKVYLAYHVLKANPLARGVAWFDTDALVVNPNITFDSFFHGHNVDVIVSPDPPPWDAPMNAGVWFVKNTPMGLRILKEWLKLYSPSEWTKSSPDSWKSKSVWAGDGYEQGQFCKNMLPTFKAHIRVVSHEVLQADTVTPRAFSAHLASFKKGGLQKLLDKLGA